MKYTIAIIAALFLSSVSYASCRISMPEQRLFKGRMCGIGECTESVNMDGFLADLDQMPVQPKDADYIIDVKKFISKQTKGRFTTTDNIIVTSKDGSKAIMGYIDSCTAKVSKSAPSTAIAYCQLSYYKYPKRPFKKILKTLGCL